MSTVKLWKKLKGFASAFAAKFGNDEVTTMAASLAFYSSLSLAPLVVLFVTLSAFVSDTLQEEFIAQTEMLVGLNAGEAVRLIMDSAKERPDLKSASGIFGACVLAFSASAVFGELKQSLNRIFSAEWQVEARKAAEKREGSFVMHWIRERLLSIGFVLSFIFLMLTSLIFSSVISAWLPSGEELTARLISWTASFAIQAAIFTLIYRYVPERRAEWRNAFLGGLITSFLFATGKELVGLYLGKSAIASAYGAAGSVVVLFIWIYYSSLIVFSGAELSYLLTFRKGEIQQRAEAA